MIGTVQALRILAAGMVLVSHIQHEVLERNFLDTPGYVAWTPVYLAGGVDIFFVISGFIMFRISRNAFGKPGESAQFLVKRFARIAPAYWFFTAAMVLATILLPGDVAHNKLTPSWVLLSALFIPSADPYGRWYPVLRLGWTLNFEFLFYMMFAVALLFERRRGVTLLLAGLAALSLIGYLDVAHSAPFVFWCNTIVLEFAMGMALAHAHSEGRRLSNIGSFSFVAVALAIMVAMQSIGIAARNWNYRFLWMGVPAFLLCTGLTLCQDIPEGRIKNAVVFGGDISYALYLSHTFTINVVGSLFKLLAWRQVWLYEVVGITVSFAVSGLFFVIAERPTTTFLSQRINHFFSVRRAPATSAA